MLKPIKRQSLSEAVFEQLRLVLPRTTSRRVVLVSAGMLGKIYCHWIKQAGGVAIDIGSAADHWCGYATRGMAEIALYRSPSGTAAMVRSIIERDPRYSRLLVERPPVQRTHGLVRDRT